MKIIEKSRFSIWIPEQQVQMLQFFSYSNIFKTTLWLTVPSTLRSLILNNSVESKLWESFAKGGRLQSRDTGPLRNFIKVEQTAFQTCHQSLAKVSAKLCPANFLKRNGKLVVFLLLFVVFSLLLRPKRNSISNSSIGQENRMVCFA